MFNCWINFFLQVELKDQADKADKELESVERELSEMRAGFATSRLSQESLSGKNVVALLGASSTANTFASAPGIDPAARTGRSRGKRPGQKADGQKDQDQEPNKTQESKSKTSKEKETQAKAKAANKAKAKAKQTAKNDQGTESKKRTASPKPKTKTSKQAKK